ncbi:hypothetical protein RHSIM_Rhsim12G0184600 [Rhododendron simsii]|uniref:J domain-containing protein n=1 Tax=Rhododendron simsii TaxID=118357 RepID=A0A834G3S1_RHOSS|nr:hypothetical protein RHSIM_Rhsim12G0184600 [Rhododendron simsii]
MATAVGFVSGGAHGSSCIRSKNKAVCRVSCVSSSTTTRDPYKTLMVKPGASKSEVKKAFRRLALRYHPDVCRGGHCSIQFQRVNEAYDMVMSNLRGELTRPEMKMYEPSDAGTHERKRETYDWNGAMDDPFWDESDVWLGVGM